LPCLRVRYTLATAAADSSSLFSCSVDRRHLHSFPTRRSSDLLGVTFEATSVSPEDAALVLPRPSSLARSCARAAPVSLSRALVLDRKSTRLNSSHVAISYAVFCLKKKINPPYTKILQREPIIV